MHVHTGESGWRHLALGRFAIASLFACVSCVSQHQPRGRIGSTRSQQEPQPEPPVQQEAPPKTLEESQEELRRAREEELGPTPESAQQEPQPAPPVEQEPSPKTIEEWQEELRRAREEELGPTPEQESELAEPSEAELAQASDWESAAPAPRWVHGSLAMRYRGRTSGDDEDHELSNILTLDVADPKSAGISGHLLARMDVDGEGKDDGETFGDLSDTYGADVIGKLYLAYADIPMDAESEDSPGLLRIGRQSDPLLPEVLRLDGVSYVSQPLGKREVEIGAYGGIPVHLYESSAEGDSAFGTFVEGRPWEGGQARFDWMHLEDEEVLGEGQDDLLALGLWHNLPEHWRFEGEYTHLEGDPRDLRFRTLYDDGKSETIVRAEYYELLETQTARVTELDPFYEDLLEYFPFRQATFNVSQTLGDRTVVDVGFHMRRVSDSGDVGEFNRDWERYYATATVSDLGTEGLALSVTVDRWNDEDRDTSSLGTDLSYDADENWTAAIGTFYSLYKYSLLEFDEREDVRTYFLRARREISESFNVDFMYEYEDDDFDTYHTLRLGALWRF